MKRSILFITAAIILVFAVCSSAVEPERKTFRTSGIVLTYNSDVLRIQERINVGILRLYSFKITKDTTISGKIRENGWVVVIYTRKRFGKRWKMIAVDILGLG
ncbi:MAG: hypothetical protein NTY14_06170 [Candidatus Omnitrophica bacterium]|nr:hypothetical protein [Candidatus Omnitrophota bacterium]